MAITIGRDNQQLNTDALLQRALHDGLNVRVTRDNTWTYPVTGSDGRIGKLSVSRFRETAVTGANQALAVHLTFTINQIFVPSLTGARRPTPQAFTVQIANLHFTARPVNVQYAIDNDNFVANTPGNRSVATHRGETNAWLHAGSDQRARDIANFIGLNAGTAQELRDFRTAIAEALNGYTGAALTTLRNSIINSFQSEINDNLSPTELRGRVPIEVTFE